MALTKIFDYHQVIMEFLHPLIFVYDRQLVYDFVVYFRYWYALALVLMLVMIMRKKKTYAMV